MTQQRRVAVPAVVGPWLSHFVAVFAAVGLAWGFFGSLIVPEPPGGVVVVTAGALAVGAAVGLVAGMIVAGTAVVVVERDAGRGVPLAGHVAGMRTVVLVTTAPLLLPLVIPLLALIFLVPNGAAVWLAYRMKPRIVGRYYPDAGVSWQGRMGR